MNYPRYASGYTLDEDVVEWIKNDILNFNNWGSAQIKHYNKSLDEDMDRNFRGLKINFKSYKFVYSLRYEPKWFYQKNYPYILEVSLPNTINGILGPTVCVFNNYTSSTKDLYKLFEPYLLKIAIKCDENKKKEFNNSIRKIINASGYIPARFLPKNFELLNTDLININDADYNILNEEEHALYILLSDGVDAEEI